HRTAGVAMGAGAEPLPPPVPVEDAVAGCVPIAVCGAHLSGLPLNAQLTDRGARLLEATRTAPTYRLYALAGGPPRRPGLVRDAGGVAVEVEVWAVPREQVGGFLELIPAPLGLGKLELADGRWVNGFICEPCGLEGAMEISAWGGWRNWLAEGAA
ncbi:MAG: allophanate hydrolase, partial [Thiogranum sp.]|nr:allophanate hydrolase [Thiogranum sp.]